jgi:uncharacterized protein (DUF362 family)
MKECSEIFYQKNFSRRKFLLGLAGILSTSLLQKCSSSRNISQTFITTAKDYSVDFKSRFLLGLKELKVNPEEIKGKRILLKPNLVEPHQGANQINTHPLVIRGAVEAFHSLGARKVLVGEGAGHMRDSLLVLEESGVAVVLSEDKVPFVDLNNDAGFTVENQGGKSRLKRLTLPETLRQVDWIVSLAKMKTHHWAGVTLSMKNMFGVMPGIFYGFPKNVLHWAGIDEAILDINMNVKPHFAIIDGIVGMEGDGPIMGKPKKAGVLVMGRNLTAVDASCCRIMGINPFNIKYLKQAAKFLGPIREEDIIQVGESINSVQTSFELLETIPAQKGIRL